MTLLQQVKDAARGRWVSDILPTFGFNPECLDGRHGPCPDPACGGKDRFRALNDCAETGAVICNNCFHEHNGDGIAAIQHYNRIEFREVVAAVAEHLGIVEDKPTSSTSDPLRKQFIASGTSTESAQNRIDDTFNRFCAAKPPITIEALKAAGAELVTWPVSNEHGQACIAFKAELRPGETTGYILRRADGRDFDGYRRLQPRKTHMLRDSADGWVIPGGWERLARARVVWIVEGVPDALALFSVLPDDYAVATNICGAKACPQNIGDFAGKVVFVVGDADEPGQEGAIRKATKMKTVADSVKTVALPYEIAKTHGKDLRDYFVDGHNFAELLAIAEIAQEFEKPKKKSREKLIVAGFRPEVTGPNEAGDDPHRLARLFIEHSFRLSNGLQTLAWWQGGYWHWDGLRWVELKKHELLAKLTAFVKAEFDRINIFELENWSPKNEDELPPEVWPVTKSLLNNVDNAVASISAQPDSLAMPDWLCGDPPFPAREVLASTKTLLHLPSLFNGKVAGISPTPLLFSANGLKYDYNPAATCPTWLKFVDSVWLEDFDSIRCLQEWFGYLLLPDTRQHKLLMLIGPPRSGKGTIVRVLQELLGEGNVASPTLSSLAGPFGLWPMLNKFVALIPDARLSGRDDSVAVVERILSITGEDPQDIHRKNMPTLTGVRMPVRFVLLSNELPNMKDASGAFMTRVNLLRMTQSFVGREDRTLTDRLHGELPGILNWAIEGWRRLNERGYFVQPASADELLSDLENLSSPIRQFIADACHTGPEYESSIETLFHAWQAWCERNHRDHAGTTQTFGKDLRAALPQLSVVQRRDGDQRERRYSGIGVKIDW